MTEPAGSAAPQTTHPRRASLRRRLSVATAIGVFALSAAAAFLVGLAQWQEQTNSLLSDVEFEAFQLSELVDLEEVRTDLVDGTNSFAVALDDNAEVVTSAGAMTEELLNISEDLWRETADVDLLVTSEFELGDGAEFVAAGSACANRNLCDSVVVGRSPTPLATFLMTRLPWLLLPAAIAALIAFVGARWMVGRALQPVEAMRAELDVITASSLDRRVPQPATGDELERLADTLNHTLSRLQTSTEATQRFAADAAHELRSPITGVRAAVELRAADDELLGQALGELDRANRLIDDLLVLAKRQQVKPRREDVDLDDLIRSHLLVARARFADVSFEEQLTPARIIGDGDALRRVVDNVIENAATHCKAAVRITLMPLDDGYRLQVDDDGPGIPQADRVRVFERFARLDASRSRATGGTGLGLALVAELVADHRGTVTVDTADLGGARLIIDLPAG